MAKHEDFPGASSYKDRHGKERWRYRRGKRQTKLEGQPGDAQFEWSYNDAVAGRKYEPRPHAVVQGLIKPRSFEDAWRRYKKYDDWRIAAESTRNKNEHLADLFLNSEIEDGTGIYWRMATVSDLRRRHIKQLLAKHGETPHKAKHMLTTIRKMILVALDEDWIEYDPSARMGWRPAYAGWSAWSPEQIRQFVKRWPAGTTPHLVFSIALWLGNRRSDIVKLKWEQRGVRKVMVGDEIRLVRGFEVEQVKGGKVLFLPEAPFLTEALEKTERRGPTVVVTKYGLPFSEKSLTGRMSDWRQAAGLPKGLTLHGLRKTLGKMMAEGGASTRQLMDVLGHDNIKHAELYSRDANQVRMAVDGIDKAVAIYGDG